MIFKTKWFSGNVEVEKKVYSNDRIALILKDSDTGMIAIKASVNMPDIGCPEGHVYIKDYNENEGVLDELVRLKIVEEPIATVNAGQTVVHLCRMLI